MSTFTPDQFRDNLSILKHSVATKICLTINDSLRVGKTVCYSSLHQVFYENCRYYGLNHFEGADLEDIYARAAAKLKRRGWKLLTPEWGCWNGSDVPSWKLEVVEDVL